MVAIVINAPAKKVWKAITDPALRKKWFFGVDTKTDWKVGSPVLHTGTWQDKPYEDKGVVKTFDPPKKLVHTHWSSMSGRPDKPENYETVTYTLTALGDSTEVAIVEDNVATPQQRANSLKMWADAMGELKKVAEN